MTKQAAERRGPKESDGERWTEQHARSVLDAWEKSGEPISVFARRIGVIPQRLFWWRRRLGRAASGEPSVAFVPVTVRPRADLASAAQGAPVVLTVDERVRVDVRDLDARTAAWVAALLVHLGETRS